MAGEKDEAVVELDDDEAITVELDDEVVAEGAEDDGKQKQQEVAPKDDEEAEPPKGRVERQRLKAPDAEAEGDDDAAVQETLRKAEEARKRADDERQAALATAKAERERREEAERRVAQSEEERRAAQEEAQGSQLNLLVSTIETQEQLLKTQEEEYARALEAGEFAKVAQLQTRMAKTAAALDRLSAQKEAFESTAKRAPTTEGRVEHVPTPRETPLEGYLRNFAPEAQAWLRSHPECAPPEVGGNAQANAKMMHGHYAAVAAGHALNSPDYFRVVEEHTGHRQAPEATVTEKKPQQEQQPPRRQAAPSAPPSRQPPAADGSTAPRSVREVRLTKEQQEAAKISFPDKPDKEAFALYARNLVELTKEGKMGRLSH